MTAREFAENMMENCPDLGHMTLDEARADIEEFVRWGGELDEDVTPESYAAEWNGLIDEMERLAAEDNRKLHEMIYQSEA